MSSSGSWGRNPGVVWVIWVIWAGTNILGGCAGSTALLWLCVCRVFSPCTPHFWGGCGAAGSLLGPAEHPEIFFLMNKMHFLNTEGDPKLAPHGSRRLSRSPGGRWHQQECGIDERSQTLSQKLPLSPRPPSHPKYLT